MSAIIQSQWMLICDNHVGLIRQLSIKTLQFPQLFINLQLIKTCFENEKIYPVFMITSFMHNE